MARQRQFLVRLMMRLQWKQDLDLDTVDARGHCGVFGGREISSAALQKYSEDLEI